MHSKILPALCLAIAFSSAPIATRAARNDSTNPGRYTDWHGVDEVTIAQPFQLRNFARVMVEPLDTRGAALPDAKDNTYAAVKEALAASTEPFAAGLREKLSGSNVQVQIGRGGAKALVVRARIIKSDPGSQAARYFGGFGAGAAQVGISGEIIDGNSGKTLLRFTQERRSGVGLFGGGYRALLDRSLKQIGGDVAGLLRAF